MHPEFRVLGFEGFGVLGFWGLRVLGFLRGYIHIDIGNNETEHGKY